jgi:hypothetical protein
MPDYVVNTTRQYDEKGKLYYEVHLYPRANCTSPEYPTLNQQMRIGSLKNCSEALARAEAMGYKRADGCSYCCKECHKR